MLALFARFFKLILMPLFSFFASHKKRRECETTVTDDALLANRSFQR